MDGERTREVWQWRRFTFEALLPLRYYYPGRPWDEDYALLLADLNAVPPNEHIEEARRVASLFVAWKLKQ